jgi:hypothetical protein
MTDSPNSAKTDPESETVSVKLAHPYDGKNPDTTIKVDAVEAKRLRRIGIAQPED